MGGGGAERQLAYLAAPLAACGWDVHVALGAGGPNLARLQEGGATVHWLAGAGNHDPRLAWQLGRLFRRIRPDLVQVWFVQMEVLAGMMSELLHVPWILSERSSVLAYPPSLKNRVRVAIARTADAVVSNSAAGDLFWNERAGARLRRFVIPNALPLDEIGAAVPAVPATLPVGSEDAVVLFAGRFGPEKNVDRLLAALPAIVRRPRTIAVLCGDGPLKAGAQETIAAWRLADRILTPGYVAEIWPLMKSADVMVAPGLFEGRPNSVLEAMACGLPLVVSDIPAHREILDERSALFADPLDARALADSVLSVLDNAAGARQRADAARVRVAGWSVSAVAAQYDGVYRQVLNTRRAAQTLDRPNLT